METITNSEELRRALGSRDRSGIGFVPTMGALHAGHRSLVERARRECATVVVSVFVNPTQFNDKTDLKNYPRTPEADLRLLEEVGADYVFMPSVEEVYPEPDTRTFDFGMKPAKAYFGEKDFQQIAVIREMVRQLRIPVEIIPCPIVRGEDGLALSSRNTLLDTDHRTAAPYIYKVLKAAVEKSHQTTPDQLAAWVTAQVESNPLLKVIYFQVVDAATMQQVRTWEESPVIQGCIAVQAGDIRLIDNIKLR